MNAISIMFAIIAFTTLCSCGGGSSGGNADTNEPAQSISSTPTSFRGSIQSNIITSTITGVRYSYRVYLPYQYDQSTKNYPIIYSTDGQFMFSPFSAILDSKNKDVIFVGIDDAGRRLIDFSTSGAPNYMAFFKTEFVPFIESQYRTNHERTFVGYSYGGLLGSQFLNIEPVGTPYFKNYMLFDASFWALTNSNIQDEIKRLDASKALNINLILTSASGGNLSDVDIYQNRFESRQYEGLKIYRRSYQLSHESVFIPSFADTIDFIY